MQIGHFLTAREQAIIVLNVKRLKKHKISGVKKKSIGQNSAKKILEKN
jgi:hypothetical protein